MPRCKAPCVLFSGPMGIAMEIDTGERKTSLSPPSTQIEQPIFILFSTCYWCCCCCCCGTYSSGLWCSYRWQQYKRSQRNEARIDREYVIQQLCGKSIRKWHNTICRWTFMPHTHSQAKQSKAKKHPFLFQGYFWLLVYYSFFSFSSVLSFSIIAFLQIVNNS